MLIMASVLGLHGIMNIFSKRSSFLVNNQNQQIRETKNNNNKKNIFSKGFWGKQDFRWKSSSLLSSLKKKIDYALILRYLKVTDSF